MRYYENAADGYILAFGISDYGGEEINEERYEAIGNAMKNAPVETASIGYRLKTDITWEPFTVAPADPDITDEEAFDIIFGGGE